MSEDKDNTLSNKAIIAEAQKKATEAQEAATNAQAAAQTAKAAAKAAPGNKDLANAAKVVSNTASEFVKLAKAAEAELAALTGQPDKKEETKEAKLRAKGFETLKVYPAKTQAFVTADGFVFLNNSDAGNHAATLEDKIIITVKKE